MTDVTLPPHGSPEHAALVERVGERWYENNRDNSEASWDELVQRSSPYLTFVRGEASTWLAALRQVAHTQADPPPAQRDDDILDAEVVE